MVSATRESGSAARSAARHRNDTAMERRGAQVLRVMENRAPQGAKSKERLAALHPLGLSEGGKGRRAAPGLQRTGAMPRVCCLNIESAKHDSAACALAVVSARHECEPLKLMHVLFVLQQRAVQWRDQFLRIALARRLD